MNKKIYFLPLFLLAVCFSVTSCLNNNDDDDAEIDQEWKTLNETRFSQIESDASFNVLSSQSGNGSVYWKTSTVITDSDNTARITVQGKPEFTDTVVVRYEGWFFNKDGEKIIFDSSENPSLKTKLDYSHNIIQTTDPNKQKVQFSVNKVIDGWSTLLQDMKLNEEREVCIPYQLAYGATGSTYQPIKNGTAYTVIPGYTTLWFRLKVFQIIPMKGLK